MDKFCLVRSIFLIIAALFLASCSPWPPPDESEHLEIVDSGTPIPHVQGFEIRYAGLSPKEMPFFDVGYSTKQSEFQPLVFWVETQARNLRKTSSGCSVLL